MSGRHVPWASWREWEDVRDLLFAEDASSVRDGLTKVMGWRRRGKLPLGVDVSALLLGTSLKDPHGPGPSSALVAAAEVEASLQAEYSLTIIRLVNGVSDSCQKGKVAGSVSKNADSAGLHPMLVDIRHEATHNHVPSLHMLRLAASHSLSWLHTNYWTAQSDRASAAATETSNVIERLLLNQSARAAVSAPSGLSSQPSDSEADETDLIDPSMSPAALKKQQKALLGELKPLIPSSHPADLANQLLHGAPGPGAYAEPCSQALTARNQSNAATTLSLLSSTYDDLLSHVLVQCVNTLRDAKIALQLDNTQPQPALLPTNDTTAIPPPSAIESAAMWAAAALQASERSAGLAAHQPRLAYALQQLFKPEALFPGPQPAQQQQTDAQHPHPNLEPLQALYSTAASGSGGASPPSGEWKTGAVKRESSKGASPANSSQKQTHKQGAAALESSKGASSAVLAMLRTENMLLQMCKVCIFFLFLTASRPPLPPTHQCLSTLTAPCPSLHSSSCHAASCISTAGPCKRTRASDSEPAPDRCYKLRTRMPPVPL